MIEFSRSSVVRCVSVVGLLLATSCSNDKGSDGPIVPTSSTTAATSTTTTPTSTSTPTTSTTTTSSTTSTSTSTTVVFPTTTIHTVPGDCDVAGLLAEVDATLELARLDPGGAWSFDGTTVFDERTNDAEEFRDRLALDCRVRAVQTTANEDRLVVAAWTGERRAFVVQASGAPSTPYRPDQRLQLLFEQPEGEWLVDQEVWAGTLAGGETVVVAVDDYSLGATAKAWQALPRWEDIPVSIATERYAIDVLLQAGARNVSPGEEPAFESTIAAIQFVTPSGLPLIATVAPIGEFDPAASLVPGERTVVDTDGVEVHVTQGTPDAYAVGSVGWSCEGYVWFIDSVWGSVDELVDWAGNVIAAAPCIG